MIEIVAEIGINHNGDADTAIDMAQMAQRAGCDFVKFQKRTPELCVPEAQKNVMKSTPWGEMTYLEYKRHIELSEKEYDLINESIDIPWFFSVWDVPSVAVAMRYNSEYIKIPSAKLTDDDLVRACFNTGRTVILSTGMSDMEEVRASMLNARMMLMHAVSAYPLEDGDANLSAIHELRKTHIPVGYSDHTRGIHIPEAAAALGACMIEKHITLDRAMWGTDQGASIEEGGLTKMVRNIRAIEAAMGDGVKRLQSCEMEAKWKLRG